MHHVSKVQPVFSLLTRDPPESMKVAICVATYQRPRGLARLLEGLARLNSPPGSSVSTEIFVVDNAPEGSAAAVCESMKSELRATLHYVHEPRRGISQARNRGVEEALAAGADQIVFIDDDEVPDPGWLAELLRVQEAYDADVVGGPVLPEFEAPAPRWIVRGDFFERPRHPTGRRMEKVYTGNALIDAGLLANPALRFDERFSLTGGGDSHFFMRVSMAGHRIVWADEAIVREWNPATRVRAGWLLQRSYRAGNSWSICEQDLYPSPRMTALRVAKGMGRIGQGLMVLPLALVTGRRGLISALEKIFLGAGFVSGAFGHRYEEYRKVHGS